MRHGSVIGVHANDFVTRRIGAVLGRRGWRERPVPFIGYGTPGRVRVLGRPAAELGRPGAAARVGMLFQQGALFSAFSVLDNIAFPLRELRTLPDELVRRAALLKLQMVGLKPGDAHKMPAELSGGMIKRVALARAFVMRPAALLADEPTGSLDFATGERVMQLMLEMNRELGTTLVLVTHDRALAALCERQLLVQAGRVTQTGAADIAPIPQRPACA